MTGNDEAKVRLGMLNEERRIIIHKKTREKLRGF
jgi:hypothetical protein